MASTNRSRHTLSAGQVLLDFTLANIAGLDPDYNVRMVDPRYQVLIQAGVDNMEDFLSLSEKDLGTLTYVRRRNEAPLILSTAHCRFMVSLSAYIHDKFREHKKPVPPDKMSRAEFNEYRV